MERRAFCSAISLEGAEPLSATASRVDHWLLLEYRNTWSRDAFAGSSLSDAVKAHLREQLRLLPRSRLLFVRRPDRRAQPGLALLLARSTEGEAQLLGHELERYDDLLEVDLAGAFAGEGGPLKARDHPLLLVCTHGKHDRCCAKHGRPLYEALRARADESWVWQSSHVGGDRFAGNLVCLPEGLYFGRVGRDEAGPLLAAYLAGEIDLERYRGRSCHSFPVQAAERAVRERTGLVGIGALRLRFVERLEEGAWSVGFETTGTGERHAVAVVEEAGELAYLTCGAQRLRHPRRFVAAEHGIAGRKHTGPAEAGPVVASD